VRRKSVVVAFKANLDVSMLEDVGYFLDLRCVRECCPFSVFLCGCLGGDLYFVF
jgi:hypothetical protein